MQQCHTFVLIFKVQLIILDEEDLVDRVSATKRAPTTSRATKTTVSSKPHPRGGSQEGPSVWPCGNEATSNMKLTLKNLQQQTFTLDIDPDITVSDQRGYAMLHKI